MTFQYFDDHAEDAVPLKRRGTKKKVWNNQTQTWRDVTIWTVDLTRDLREWLESNYADHRGWGLTWTDTKVTMEEPIYIHYCLVFGA
jgi:hypothetical protein